MCAGDLVSIIIPCYNPPASLPETIASARSQTHGRVEIILVDDGTSSTESKTYLQSAATLVDRYIEQSNRGVSAARNAGIRAASGSFFVPLDCQDLLEPSFISECLACLECRPGSAFAYPDFRVFGNRTYTQRLPDYNFYDLLEQNTVSYAAVVRTRDWSAAGGYDESLFGYEDWEFWIRLGARGRFGTRVAKMLWAYRKHGDSLFERAKSRHEDLVARIQNKNSSLYSPEGLARVKTAWKPAVCVVGTPPAAEQTIVDWVCHAPSAATTIGESRADVFLFPAARHDAQGSSDPHLAEIAALSLLGGRKRARLPDGSMVLSRQALARFREGRLFTPISAEPKALPPSRVRSRNRGAFGWPLLADILKRLDDAELLAFDSWRNHPGRSLARLIPLRVKEKINRLIGRSVFDLTFYLRFQPRALMLGRELITPVRYIPKVGTNRKVVGFVTPHLGAGGAEAVLLEVVQSLGREDHEILLIAADSRDSRWLSRWREHVDHVFDLRSFCDPGGSTAALLSILSNWGCDLLWAQNALACYQILPSLRSRLPDIKIVDMLHGFAENWSLLACTESVSHLIDLRIVVSEHDRNLVLACGAPPGAVRTIRSGTDLARFRRASGGESQLPHRILFAARLDAVKRPALLPKIARELALLRPQLDFKFVVAGDGPEAPALRSAIRRTRTEHVFELLGHVEDLAPVIAESALVIITSSSEGIPLVLLESCACGIPVISSNVGGIGEVIGENTGVLIARDGEEAFGFATAIDRLLSQPNLRLEMGALARSKMEREYDRARSRREYREVMDQLLNGERANRFSIRRLGSA